MPEGTDDAEETRNQAIEQEAEGKPQGSEGRRNHRSGGAQSRRRQTAAKDIGLKATREWAGISGDGMAWYRWMLADGRQMTVELKIQLLKHELSGGMRIARVP